MWPYWNRHYLSSINGLTQWQNFVNAVLNDNGVTDRLETQDTVTMKIRKGDKVYRVVVSDITQSKEEMEIEFEGDEPNRHPDFTE
jgi:uncharacterized membrane-anchored protein